MQCCPLFKLRIKNNKHPNFEWRGEGTSENKKIPTPTLFEYNVSTILSPIVGVKSDSYFSVCEWNPLE